MLRLSLPPYGMAAVIVLLLYAIQSELRFGSKARASLGGQADRGSTLVLSLSSLVVIAGFVIAMRPPMIARIVRVPDWLIWPGAEYRMEAVAWGGVTIAILGLIIRLWAVLTLRQRYTRTLLINDGHKLERRGPYGLVRHPGYLGSLLFLNGFALASLSASVLLVSLVVTISAYAYRIRVEDRMLIAEFGAAYETYKHEVGALLPRTK